MEEKKFKVPKRDGSKAFFVFTRPERSIWYWDLPKKDDSGMLMSLSLPDVELGEAKTLKECLNLIGKARGEEWVGQVVVDLLKM